MFTRDQMNGCPPLPQTSDWTWNSQAIYRGGGGGGRLYMRMGHTGLYCILSLYCPSLPTIVGCYSQCVLSSYAVVPNGLKILSPIGSVLVMLDHCDQMPRNVNSCSFNSSVTSDLWVWSALTLHQLGRLAAQQNALCA